MLQCCSTAGISIPLLSICGLRSIKCMSCGQEHTCLNEPVLTGSGEGAHAPEDTFDLGGVHRRIAATGAVMGGYRVCLCPGCCHWRGWDCLSSVTGDHLAFSACRCIDMGDCQDFCCSLYQAVLRRFCWPDTVRLSAAFGVVCVAQLRQAILLACVKP